MSKYRIVFNGRDYSDFEDCLKNTKIYDDQDKFLEGSDLPFGKEESKKILIEFLKSFDEKELSSIYKNLGDDCEDEEANGDKKKLYTEWSDKYMFNGQIGFLRKRDFKYLSSTGEQHTLDITLRCTSRFDEDANKGFFLCAMLLHSDLSFVDSLVPTDDNDDMFEYMLLFRYVSLLREAFTKGYYKKYVTFQNNDDRLKGSIDIARHLRLNSGYDNGKMAYSYRENTVKNPLNMLIVAAYHKLKKEFPDMMDTVFTRDDEDIINTLKAELGYYDCSVSELLKQNGKPIYHPYYFEYEGLRAISLKILRDEGLNLFAAEEISETNGYLVYIPNLWEKFLEDHFNQINGWHVKAQDSHSVVKSEEGKFALQIRPDFVFYNGSNKPCVMIDAKFIPKWEIASIDGNFSKVSNDFNKCVRDMTCLEIHATGVAFPCKETGGFKSYKINGTDKFYALGIKIPPTDPPTEQNDTFYSWNTVFEQSVRDQISAAIETMKNSLLPV